MEMFWRTKGKRIAAWLMIALIIATTIPFGSISASADDSSDLQADGTIVTVTGTVLVPNDTGSSDSNGNETAYQGAEVRVVYQNGGTAKTTSVATTDEDGKFTITLAPAYAFPLLVPVFSLVSSGTITCPVIVTVPLSPVAVLSADALILPNGIVVAIINAIINHAAILFPFVLQNISIF